ncbi:MAG TPA: hypothetical protein PLN21_02405 [Gemmatales bacterium]|nr:hypothetical protein [Gemmatales bacterium]
MSVRNGPVMTNGSGHHGDREPRNGKKKVETGRKSTTAKAKKQPKK